MRLKAKTVNFGIIYGQTRYGLAEALSITPQEAQEFIDKYFETYPKIKEYMETTKIFAIQNGYVETRHFYFPKNGKRYEEIAYDRFFGGNACY